MTSLRIERGSKPWAPSSHSELIEVWDRYDRPTLGVFRAEGRLFTFECIEGLTSTVSMWIYTEISEYDFKTLRDLEDEEFLGELSQALADRPYVVATSIESDQGERVVAWADVSDPDEYIHPAEPMVERLTGVLSDLTEEMHSVVGITQNVHRLGHGAKPTRRHDQPIVSAL